MLQRLKSAGEMAGGVVVLVLLFAFSFVTIWAFIKGAEWLVVNTLQWILGAAWIALAVDVLILLPLAIFRRLRVYCAIGLLYSSYLFGFTTWLYGFIFTYALWGTFMLIVGLCFMGVGVVFMGILATAFRGMWSGTATLVGMLVLTFGMRFFSAWLAVLAERALSVELSPEPY